MYDLYMLYKIIIGGVECQLSFNSSRSYFACSIIRSRLLQYVLCNTVVHC